VKIARGRNFAKGLKSNSGAEILAQNPRV